MSSKKRGSFYSLILSLFFIVLLFVLIVIGFNSNYLIRKPVFYFLLILLIIFIVLLIISIRLFIKNKVVVKRWVKYTLIGLFSIYIIGSTSFLVLLYGPNDKFRTWLICTAMKTMNHQYLCKWFYNEDTINFILDSNYIEESGESTDESLITQEMTVTYKNEYEKEILDVEEGTKYKIIELEVNGCNAYLAAIYDPSMVKLAVTSSLGTIGEYVTKMAEKNNALLAINGGGFYDPGNSSLGGTPNGITIKDSSIITNGEYGNSTGGLIGITKDNVLVLLKNVTAEDAINMGVRDAVSWGPFLIVNSNPSFVKGNGGWGYAARTAIGQREDGIILFLVVDSNATRTNGADMGDLVEIMQNYGAVNAANLDGGTSSVMVLPKDIAINNYNAACNDYFTNYYCAINDPIDSTLAHRTRYIADAWIVVDN